MRATFRKHFSLRLFLGVCLYEQLLKSITRAYKSARKCFTSRYCSGMLVARETIYQIAVDWLSGPGGSAESPGHLKSGSEASRNF